MPSDWTTASRASKSCIKTADGKKKARFANFSVEMETGTGKTYVYLRTALDLFRRYGLRKFIIVVPSVAVREGVLKTLQVTEAHLRDHLRKRRLPLCGLRLGQPGPSTAVRPFRWGGVLGDDD